MRDYDGSNGNTVRLVFVLFIKQNLFQNLNEQCDPMTCRS